MTTDFTIQPPKLEVYTELDADTVGMLGLDPTGRDGDPRFPYTIGKLTLPELLLLQAITNQDVHYSGEMPEYAGAFLWYDAANAEVEHRLGEEATEHYYAWSTDNRMTAEELIKELRGTSSLDHVLRVIAGE
jgi:hypothetical protein